jgi:outer membrane protein assembly factor BamB
LDKQTGQTLWTNTEIRHSAAYCSPIVVEHDGVRQLITLTQRSVVGVGVADGNLIWSAPFVPTYPQNALTPVYHAGHVYVACGHSTGGSLLRIDAAAGTATTVWHRKDLDNCHGGALLIDGRLYGPGCRMGGRHFFCVDFFTGSTIKLDRSLGKVGITFADGRIYCLNHHGTVSLLEITDDGFEIVSQFNLDRRPVNSYLAHPVICDGRLYLRGEEDLYVYDIRAK